MTPNARAQAAFRARQKELNPEAYYAKRREENRKWQTQNREKHNAHNAVYSAVRRGKLIRASECERCGMTCKTEGSHDDYAKPLEVEWLCRTCHARKDLGKGR